MSRDDSSLGCIVGVLAISISIGSGILAWDFTHPKSFFGVLFFLLIWGIFSTIGYFIAIAIGTFFDENS